MLVRRPIPLPAVKGRAAHGPDPALQFLGLAAHSTALAYRTKLTAQGQGLVLAADALDP